MILDLMMPQIDGFEMLKQIRQSAMLKFQKVIISSASVSLSVQERAAVAGGNAFLPKPVDVVQLCDLIAQQLDLEWQYRVSKVATSVEQDFSSLEREKLAGDALELPRLEELLESLLTLMQRGLVQELRQLVAEQTQAQRCLLLE